MPITGPATYLPTIAEFLGHWEAVDTALGGVGSLVLTGGTNIDSLDTLRENLETVRDAVTDAGVERALAREFLTDQARLLQTRVVEFNGRLRADLPDSPYSRTLPEAFSVGQGETIIREGLRQMAKIWKTVNAITNPPAGLVLPLQLMEDYTLAMFDADREALRNAYRALSDAEVDLRIAREKRNDVQDAIYPILKNYRLKVPTVLPAGNALIESLPALTVESGRTPTAVVAQAVWDAAQSEAKVTWAASTDADLKEYQVRGVPGPDYTTDDESLLATVPPGAPRELATAFALSAPGVTAGFKVYVVLKSGHEKGSEAVFVTRPGG